MTNKHISPEEAQLRFRYARLALDAFGPLADDDPTPVRVVGVDNDLDTAGVARIHFRYDNDNLKKRVDVAVSRSRFGDHPSMLSGSLFLTSANFDALNEETSRFVGKYGIRTIRGAQFHRDDRDYFEFEVARPALSRYDVKSFLKDWKGLGEQTGESD